MPPPFVYTHIYTTVVKTYGTVTRLKCRNNIEEGHRFVGKTAIDHNKDFTMPTFYRQYSTIRIV